LSEFSFTFHFERPLLNGSSGSIVLGDLPNVSRPGMPSLPCESVKIQIPEGYDLVNIWLETESLRLAGYLDSPPLIRGAASLCHDQSRSWALPTPLRYLPEEVEKLGVFLWHGRQVAVVNLYPIVVDLISGAVTYSPEMELRLSLRVSGNMERGTDFPDPVMIDTIQPVEGLSQFEYVIITSQELQPAFEELVDWKASRGSSSSQLRNMTATVVSVEWISSQPEFWGNPWTHDGTGNDTQTQTRNFISWAYANWGTRYVLLGGDDEIVPARHVKVFAHSSRSIPADLYYAGLDGDWDSDGDGIYGEGVGEGGGSSGEEADLLPEVQVGRATVDSQQEAENFVSKVLAYESERSSGYLNNSLLVGERLDTIPTWGGDYKDEVRSFAFPETNPVLNVETLYERDDTFSAGAFLSALDGGVHIVNHMGHGDWDEFADLRIEDVQALSNTEYFIMFSQACLIGAFDQQIQGSQDAIAEYFISSSAGAVAMIVNSREGWYSPGDTDGSSQQYDIEFFDALFNEHIRSLGATLNDAKTDLVAQVQSTGTMRWCYMALNLLGDPETEIHFLEERDHDLAVQDLEVGDAYNGVQCQVGARIVNLGTSNETGVPVELLVEGHPVSTRLVDIDSNQSCSVNFEWVPDTPGVVGVSVRSNLSTDSWSSNDVAMEIVVVDWLISGTEFLEGDHLVQTNILVNASGCLILSNSTLTLDPLDDNPLTLEVLGALRSFNSTLNFTGSPGFQLLTAPGSELLLSSSLMGNPGEMTALIDVETYGRLTIEGSELWSIDGMRVIDASDCLISDSSMFVSSSLRIEGCHRGAVSHLSFEGPGEGIVLEDCESFSFEGEIRAGQSGLSMINCTNCWVNDTLITDCEEGLRISDCSLVHLLNNTIVNNTYDFGLFGSVPGHFHHLMSGNMVSSGELLYLDHQDYLEIGPDSEAGILILISCREIGVSGLDLSANLHGLLIVNCTSVLVNGCNLSDNAVGLEVMQSQGVIVHGNDFLGNLVQVEAVSVLLNGSYSEAGNYWDDYVGVDVHSGPAQDQPQGDGIGDFPHALGSGVVDSYPLMRRANIDNQPPSAGFSVSEGQLLTGQMVSIEDLSSDVDGVIVNWTWDMGDGTRIYSRHVIHSYSQDGNYTVTLWVMDDSRQWGSTSKQVTVSNRPPQADFVYAPEFPLVGQEVSFTDRSHDQDGEIVSWNWSFGDGTHSPEISPSHIFSTKGDYTVTLLVKDDDGDISSFSKGLRVGNVFPIADFSFLPGLPLTGEQIQFTDLSIDPDGMVTSWYWIFGDGTESRNQNPVHIYDDDGHYTVYLEVKDDSGAKSTISTDLEVLNRPPLAGFDFSPLDPLSGEEVRFQDSSIDQDGEVICWLWDFGDGVTSSLQSPTHSFGIGHHIISLTIWDDDGANANSSLGILVHNRAPLASFSVSPDPIHSLEELTCTDLSQDPDGEIVAWNWSFGDDSYSDQRNPAHVYLRPGNYTVTLRVTDDMGAMDNRSVTLIIINLDPVSDFVWERDPSLPMRVIFQSMAYDPEGENLSYRWDFGDGSPSTQQDPVHDFASEGIFTVTLTVVDDHLGSSTSDDSIEVFIPDITIGEVFLPANMRHEEAFQLMIIIMNQGLSSFENATIDLLVDGLIMNTTVLSLEGNSSASLFFQLSLPGGNHTLEIVADGCEMIGESNEDNNSVLLQIQMESSGESPLLLWLLLLIILAFIPIFVLVISMGRKG